MLNDRLLTTRTRTARGGWLLAAVLLALVAVGAAVALTVTGARASGSAHAPSAPNAVLYDQIDNYSSFYASSQENHLMGQLL
jgi:hypothetical protein